MQKYTVTGRRPDRLEKCGFKKKEQSCRLFVDLGECTVWRCVGRQSLRARGGRSDLRFILGSRLQKIGSSVILS